MGIFYSKDMLTNLPPFIKNKDMDEFKFDNRVNFHLFRHAFSCANIIQKTFGLGGKAEFLKKGSLGKIRSKDWAKNSDISNIGCSQIEDLQFYLQYQKSQSQNQSHITDNSLWFVSELSRTHETMFIAMMFDLQNYLDSGKKVIVIPFLNEKLQTILLMKEWDNLPESLNGTRVKFYNFLINYLQTPAIVEYFKKNNDIVNTNLKFLLKENATFNFSKIGQDLENHLKEVINDDGKNKFIWDKIFDVQTIYTIKENQQDINKLYPYNYGISNSNMKITQKTNKKLSNYLPEHPVFSIGGGNNTSLTLKKAKLKGYMFNRMYNANDFFNQLPQIINLFAKFMIQRQFNIISDQSVIKNCLFFGHQYGIRNFLNTLLPESVKSFFENEKYKVYNGEYIEIQNISFNIPKDIEKLKINQELINKFKIKVISNLQKNNIKYYVDEKFTFTGEQGDKNIFLASLRKYPAIFNYNKDTKTFSQQSWLYTQLNQEQETILDSQLYQIVYLPQTKLFLDLTKYMKKSNFKNYLLQNIQEYRNYILILQKLFINVKQKIKIEQPNIRNNYENYVMNLTNSLENLKKQKQSIELYNLITFNNLFNDLFNICSQKSEIQVNVMKNFSLFLNTQNNKTNKNKNIFNTICNGTTEKDIYNVLQKPSMFGSSLVPDDYMKQLKNIDYDSNSNHLARPAIFTETVDFKKYYALENKNQEDETLNIPNEIICSPELASLETCFLTMEPILYEYLTRGKKIKIYISLLSKNQNLSYLDLITNFNVFYQKIKENQDPSKYIFGNKIKISNKLINKLPGKNLIELFNSLFDFVKNTNTNINTNTNTNTNKNYPYLSSFLKKISSSNCYIFANQDCIQNIFKKKLPLFFKNNPKYFTNYPLISCEKITMNTLQNSNKIQFIDQMHNLRKFPVIMTGNYDKNNFNIENSFLFLMKSNKTESNIQLNNNNLNIISENPLYKLIPDNLKLSKDIEKNKFYMYSDSDNNFIYDYTLYTNNQYLIKKKITNGLYYLFTSMDIFTYYIYIYQMNKLFSILNNKKLSNFKEFKIKYYFYTSFLLFFKKPIDLISKNYGNEEIKIAKKKLSKKKNKIGYYIYQLNNNLLKKKKKLNPNIISDLLKETPGTFLDFYFINKIDQFNNKSKNVPGIYKESNISKLTSTDPKPLFTSTSNNNWLTPKK